MLGAEIVKETYTKHKKSFFKINKEDAIDVVKYMILYNVPVSEAKKRCGVVSNNAPICFSEISEKAGFEVEFTVELKDTEEELETHAKSVNAFKAKTAEINLKSKKPKAVLNCFSKLAKFKKKL